MDAETSHYRLTGHMGSACERLHRIVAAHVHSEVAMSALIIILAGVTAAGVSIIVISHRRQKQARTERFHRALKRAVQLQARDVARLWEETARIDNRLTALEANRPVAVDEYLARR